MFRPFLKSALLVLFALSSVEAKAAFIVTATKGGSAEAGATVVNFDSFALGTGTITTPGMTMTFAGADGVVDGSHSGYTAPTVITDEISAADSNQYVSTGTGKATMTFAFPERYFGLLWGSVDPTNTLSFYDSNGDLLDTVTSADFFSTPNKTAGGGSYYVGVTADRDFTTVIASNTSFAFEFDNVAYAAPVKVTAKGLGLPINEASTAAIMLAALFGMRLFRARLLASPRMSLAQ